MFIFVSTNKQIEIMTKQEIIETLANCIELGYLTENVYLVNRLTKVSDALINDWEQSEMYAEEIKKILNYDETMSNLDKIRI